MLGLPADPHRVRPSGVSHDMIADVLGLPDAGAFLQVAAVLFAIAGLWLGAQQATQYASALAFKLGISAVVIGLTLVSIVTSLPEIFVNISAVRGGSGDIAAGNVIGSCFIQISFVLGLCALIAGRLSLSRSQVWRDGSMVVAANLAMLGVMTDGFIGITEALFFVAAYAAYLTYLVRSLERKSAGVTGASKNCEQEGGNEAVARKYSVMTLVLFSAASVLLVWVMADILVAVGRSAGREAGISEAIIGVWVGAGTTIPELVISVAAILRGSAGLSLGNLLGSNITDPLLSLGIGVIVGTGITISPFLMIAGIVWLVATLVAVASLVATNQIGRLVGLTLMIFYAVSQVLLLRL
jgi:cation:H+ antiporter